MADNTDVERRTFAMEWRVEAENPANPVIKGYGAVFNSLSHDLGGFREKIVPGAFARTIKGNNDIVSLFNHESSMLLGRTGNGTLTLREDKTGLYMEVNPPAHRQDVVESIRRGDVPGMSFQFVTVRDSWEGLDGKEPVRTLEEVRLLEVGPVVFPAYQATQVSARALDQLSAREAVPTPTPDPEPPREPSDPPQGETPKHSEAAADPPEQHSVTIRPLSNLAKQWRLEVEAGKVLEALIKQ